MITKKLSFVTIHFETFTRKQTSYDINMILQVTEIAHKQANDNYKAEDMLHKK